MVMNANGEYQYQVQGQGGTNIYGDASDTSEEEATAAARARATSRGAGSGGYGVDEDGQEMEDPFVALGKMFKGAWKKMKGSGKSGKEKQGSANTENANGDPEKEISISEDGSETATTPSTGQSNAEEKSKLEVNGDATPPSQENGNEPSADGKSVV